MGSARWPRGSSGGSRDRARSPRVAVGHEIPNPSWERLRGHGGIWAKPGTQQNSGGGRGETKIITHRCPVSDRARDEEFFFFSFLFSFFSFFVFN